MEKYQKNLVIVDYQYDFVAIDGKLTCGESAIAIENNILNLIDEYKNENIFVTLDTHYETDWDENTKTNEANVFPLHCVYETDGHKLYGKVEEKLQGTKYKTIFKNSFASEKLIKNILLANNPNEPIEVEFCGVATNVCVFQNILLTYNYLVQNNVPFKLVLNKNCVASFDEKLENDSIEYLKNVLGVTVR